MTKLSQCCTSYVFTLYRIHFVMLCVIAFVCLLPLSACFTCPAKSDSNGYQRLKSKLFCDYDPQERPVKKLSDVINITISLDLKHISVIDSSSQYEIHSWITVSWIDPKLEWNPEEYDSLAKLLMPHSSIWIPDLSVFNSDLTQIKIFEDTTCVIRQVGLVMCVPSLRTPIYCKHQLTRWPFDTQWCKLVLGSWAQSGEEIALHFSDEGYNMFDGVYEENNDYKLINVKVFKNTNSHCCPNISYSYMEYTFELQHHAGLYAATIIAPAFVLAGLTLMSFWVRGVTCRSCLCCTALIGDALFLQYIGFHLASDGDATPNIVLFYRDAMVLTVAALVMALLVERVREHQMPGFAAPGWFTGGASWLRGQGGLTGQLLLGEGSVEEAVNEENGTKVAVPCSSFTILLDRLAFILIFVTYAVMLAALLP